VNPQDVPILKEWMGSCRALHNQLVEAFNKKQLPTPNWMWLRKQYVIKKKDNILNKMLWTCKTPTHVREAVVKEFSTNIKTQAAKGVPFSMHFRSRKGGESSILIPKAAIKNIDHKQMKIYPSVPRDVLKVKDCPVVEHDCRLQMDAMGRFYLLVPVKISIDALESQEGKIAFLDPGVRTFQTVYSPTPGTAYKICDREMTQLHKLQLQIDVLSGLSSSNRLQSRRFRYRRALTRSWQRLKNAVDDLHYKAANFLCSHFDTIVIPTFETSRMVRRGQRRIARKVVRDMTCLSHYRFRQRLKFHSISERV